MNVIKCLYISGLAVALQVTTPQSAAARDLVCVSKGYCTIALDCNSNGAGEELNVKILKGNTAQFGWEGTDAKFTAQGVRKGAYTVYASSTDVAMQTFTLADNLSASMGVTTFLLDDLYVSFHALTCRKAN